MIPRRSSRIQSRKFVNLNDLKQNSNVNVRGVVVKVNTSKVVKSKSVRVASIELADAKRSIVLNLWGRFADQHGLCVGDVVEFYRVWIKMNTYRQMGLEASFIGREGQKIRLLYRFQEKRFENCIESEEERFVKQILEDVSKRYPRQLQKPQPSESAIRNIMVQTFDTQRPHSVEGSVDVDVVIVSLKFEKGNRLFVAARGFGSDQETKISIRFFEKCSIDLQNVLRQVQLSKERCVVRNLCFNRTIDPSTYGVCAVLDATRETRLERREDEISSVSKLSDWIHSLNGKAPSSSSSSSSIPVRGKVRASVSRLYFPSLCGEDLNSKNLINIFSSELHQGFEPFKIALNDLHNTIPTVWVYVSSELAAQILGNPSISDVVKKDKYACETLLNIVNELSNMHKNGENIEMSLVAYLHRHHHYQSMAASSAEFHSELSAEFHSEDLSKHSSMMKLSESQVSWADYDIELTGICFSF